MEQLNEKLDFNLSMEDISTMNSLMKEYIDVRKQFYKNIFCSDEEYSKEDILDYLAFFTQLNLTDDDNTEQYELVERILHFLERNYEMFIFGDIALCVETIKSIFYGEYLNDDDLIVGNEFEDLEYEKIIELENKWQEFIEYIRKYPLMNLDKMEYEEMFGCHVYFEKGTQQIIKRGFKDFIENIHKDFPNILLRFDSFILVSPSYIELCAGEGTYAFYMDDTIFFSNKYDSDEQKFSNTVFYHEFGHFIYELISETYQQYFTDCYIEWNDKGTKLSRDLSEYSNLEGADELFADSFSCLYYEPSDEGFIHKPSEIILDTVRFILEQEYKDM